MFFGKEGCSRLDERSAHLHKRQKNEESGDKQKQCRITGPGLNTPVLKSFLALLLLRCFILVVVCLVVLRNKVLRKNSFVDCAYPPIQSSRGSKMTFFYFCDV